MRPNRSRSPAFLEDDLVGDILGAERQGEPNPDAGIGVTDHGGAATSEGHRAAQRWPWHDVDGSADQGDVPQLAGALDPAPGHDDVGLGGNDANRDTTLCTSLGLRLVPAKARGQAAPLMGARL